MWERFRRSRRGTAGLAVVASLVVLALVGPALDRHAGVQKDVARGTSALGAPLPPSLERPLGSDSLGRCVAAQLFEGARASLQIAAGAALLALTIGLAVGLAAGYLGGAVDAVLMRCVDLVLAFPFLLLVIALAALLRDSGAPATVLVLGVAGWTGVARVVRGKVLVLRDAEFVVAARAAGAGAARVIVRHLLPNVAGLALVLGVTAVGHMILAESTLAYLGLGAPPPAQTWGRMMSDGQAFLRGAPWLVAAPGAAIAAAVLGFNLVGEGLRAALEPRA